MNKPLVSIIVTTKNNHDTLEACLKSIVDQSYKTIELIVVDNFSTDDTTEIAKKYTQFIFEKGPERSTQRNYAVEKASGEFVLIIDSDMELDQGVVSACVTMVQSNQGTRAVIIPEVSFGQGYWAACKQLERSFYVGVGWMEAARFFDRKLFLKLGGYNERLVSGEDWDLSQRFAATTTITHIDTYIHHNEGHLKLNKTLQKKYYYALRFSQYAHINKGSSAVKKQTGVVSRYKLFLSDPIKLFKNPFVGFGMLFMKTSEFGVGGVGLIYRRYVHPSDSNTRLASQDNLINGGD